MRGQDVGRGERGSLEEGLKRRIREKESGGADGRRY